MYMLYMIIYVLGGWCSVRFLNAMEGEICHSAEVVDRYEENDEDS